MKVIILNTEFFIGNIINLKLDLSERLMILGYEINNVSNEGYVNAYRIKCGRGDGFHYWYSPFEITNENNNVGKEDIFYHGEYFLGDYIRLKCRDAEFIITEIYINKIKDFIVSDYDLRCNDGKGNLVFLKPIELNKSEILT